MKAGDSEIEIWVQLADLLYLDDEPLEYRYVNLAKKLLDASWNKYKVRKTLIELVAPVAGRNLGFIIPVTIPDWGYFDREWLISEIEKRIVWRNSAPKWVVAMQDKFFAWWINNRYTKKLLDLM